MSATLDIIQSLIKSEHRAANTPPPLIVPYYFQEANLLTKEQFIENIKSAWIRTIMKEHPEGSSSPSAQVALEQAWKDYQNMIEVFKKKRLVPMGLKRLEPNHKPFEEWSIMGYEIRKFPISLKNMDINACKNMLFLESRDALFIEDLPNTTFYHKCSIEIKNEIKFSINLPSYEFVLSEDGCSTSVNDSLTSHNNLNTLIANTFDVSATMLMLFGANVNSYDTVEGNTGLLIATAKGWCHKNTDNDGRDHRMLNDNQETIIRNLLKYKADVNACHLHNGMTPLHLACLRKDAIEFIELLLTHGADPLARDYIGRTPLDLLEINIEETKKVIETLTCLYIESVDDLSYAFGCQDFNFPSHKSVVATLPTASEMEVNKVAIRTKLNEVIAAKLNSEDNSIDEISELTKQVLK